MAISVLQRFDELPVEARLQIDRVCTRFESALRAGQQPSLETYLDDSTAGGNVMALFAELLAIELEYRRERGDMPDRRLLAERFPNLQTLIDEVFNDYDSAGSGARPGQAVPREGGNAEPTAPCKISPGVLDLAAKRPVLPTVAGYELIAESGKGGMGIVYKARHQKLNRIVALKMILAGDFASDEERMRFLIEGEMLARLHHPNIVQVFEAGHHDGRPYLALEFVNGPTLSEYFKRHPLIPRQTAGLVEQLARAVHYAHTTGIIHRDLKPANVLIQPMDPGQLGPLVTKITDFGLAKPVASSHSLSDSEWIKGTPGYMAPEQARGERNLGPAADVFSLGAILYHSLTGNAPFRADTPYDAIKLVLEHEPQRPKVIREDIPADLETICLKSLQKDPSKRYASADEFANDLRRWLDGEPITARPVGLVERVWKWSKRRPALAGSLTATSVLVVAVAVISSVAAIRLSREKERTRWAERQETIALSESLLSASPDAVPYILDMLRPAAEFVGPILNEHFHNEGESLARRRRAAIGLTLLGDSHAEFLINDVPLAPAAECRNLVAALRATQSADIVEALRARVGPGAAVSPLRDRIRYAILLLELGDAWAARELLADSDDPLSRTVFIEEYSRWHGELAWVGELLERIDDPAFRNGICSAVGRVDPTTLSDPIRERLVAVLAKLHVEARDGGTHAAAGWALRQWNVAPPVIEPSSGPTDQRQWFVNSLGMTMVRLKTGVILANNSPIELTRPFFMCSREMTVGAMGRFIKDPDFPASEKPGAWRGPNAAISPLDSCPVNNVDRADMILFCNWLSIREGRKRCYTQKGADWSCDFSANGYRLPTEAEWDYANRAGTATTFFFGNDPQWFASYAHVCSVHTVPGGGKLPNRWGMFDMVGNIWERCWDYDGGGQATGLDPIGPPSGTRWVFRGGAYDSGAYDCDSSHRFVAGGAGKSYGFRVVCGADSDDLPHSADPLERRIEAHTHALQFAPNDVRLLHARGQLHVQANHLKEATDDFRKLVACEPTNAMAAIQFASLLAQSGGSEEYRLWRDQMLAHFGETKEPVLAERIAKACSLAPCDSGKAVQLVALAQRATETNPPHSYQRFFELARGMAEYRAGRFASAVEWLTRSRDTSRISMNPQCIALAWLFQAMALHQLKQPEPARQAFATAERLLEPVVANLQKELAAVHWHDTVNARVVHDEAQSLLGLRRSP